MLMTTICLPNQNRARRLCLASSCLCNFQKRSAYYTRPHQQTVTAAQVAAAKRPKIPPAIFEMDTPPFNYFFVFLFAVASSNPHRTQLLHISDKKYYICV